MLPNFFYHPRVLEYDLGPQHPLKPERLRRTIELLERHGHTANLDPGVGKAEDALRVHDEAYVDAVREIDREISETGEMDRERWLEDEFFGFWGADNPPFAGMFQASLNYVAASVKAAEAVRDGASLAFGMAGGLHHALRNKASGFCIFDDPAIAAHVLLEKFDRVAYVDIDVHHGDGVQWIFYDDPRVLTCSIHEEGRTLFPGTGFVEETGADFTSFNVPIQARTTGDVWLWAFQQTILPALEAFEPGAIVLQMGADIHYLDRLGHLQAVAQEWLGAVEAIRDLSLPIVALGGGGYNMTTVPRMWTAACLSLVRQPFEDAVPADLAEKWEMPTMFDPVLPQPRNAGREHAERIVRHLRERHIPNIPRR